MLNKILIFLILSNCLLININIKPSTHSLYECQIQKKYFDESSAEEKTYIDKPVVAVKCDKNTLREDENQTDFNNKKQYCDRKGGKFTKICECSIWRNCDSASFENWY